MWLLDVLARRAKLNLILPESTVLMLKELAEGTHRSLSVESSQILNRSMMSKFRSEKTKEEVYAEVIEILKGLIYLLPGVCLGLLETFVGISHPKRPVSLTYLRVLSNEANERKETITISISKFILKRLEKMAQKKQTSAAIEAARIIQQHVCERAWEETEEGKVQAEKKIQMQLKQLEEFQRMYREYRRRERKDFFRKIFRRIFPTKQNAKK